MKTLLKALEIPKFKVRNETKTDFQLIQYIMKISKRPLKIFGAASNIVFSIFKLFNIFVILICRKLVSVRPVQQKIKFPLRVTVRNLCKKIKDLSKIVWVTNIITEFTSCISSTRIDLHQYMSNYSTSYGSVREEKLFNEIIYIQETTFSLSFPSTFKFNNSVIKRIFYQNAVKIQNKMTVTVII